MDANDVVESYVTDVAVLLPRRQRNDVAFELRALLTEELQGHAEAAGRAADATMAIELLRAFGRPADVAARYRPVLTIIDPADGHRFVRAAVIGLLVIWGVGLLAHLRQPLESGWDTLTVLGQWWTGVAIPSLWWPGVLVAGFAATAWTRRRWPQAQDWKPRAPDGIPGGRASMVLGLFGIMVGTYLLVDPHWLLDFFGGGKAAPAAYQALTYTEPFLRRQAPWLLALILLNIPLYLAMIISGRRSALLRRVETGLALLDCAVMLWAIADGPILMAPHSDQVAKALMLLVVAGVLVHLGVRLHRSVRPTPDQHVQAQR